MVVGYQHLRNPPNIKRRKNYRAMKGIVSGTCMKGYIYIYMNKWLLALRRGGEVSVHAKKLMDHPIIPWALAFPPSLVWQFSNQPRNVETNHRKLEPTTEKLKPTPIFFR